MKILYMCGLREGGNGLERSAAISKLGYETVLFDTWPYQTQGSRLSRSLAHRFNVGAPLVRLNSDLLTFARGQQFDAIWVDKGTWIYPETLDELKRLARRHVAVHYTPDFQFHDNRSRHFFAGLRQYDLMVTTKPIEVDQYKKAGAAEVLLTRQGCSARFQPHAAASGRRLTLAADVVFVGRLEPHYAARLQAVGATGIDLAIWGAPWPRYARRHAWAKQAVRGGGLWGEDYPAALGASRIALGLLTKRSPETATTRTFEIPASGGFLLAERTDEHLELFEEGREAEFFESDEEMVDKIGFYLSHPDARDKIAAAGRNRYVASGYMLENQFRKIFEQLARQHGLPVPG